MSTVSPKIVVMFTDKDNESIPIEKTSLVARTETYKEC